MPKIADTLSIKPKLTVLNMRWKREEQNHLKTLLTAHQWSSEELLPWDYTGSIPVVTKLLQSRTGKVCQIFQKKTTMPGMQMQKVPSHHPSLWKYLINSVSRRLDAYRCPCIGWASWARPAFIHQIWTYSITAWKKWSYTHQSSATISAVLICCLFSSQTYLKLGAAFE